MGNTKVSNIEKLRTNTFWHCVDIVACKFKKFAEFYKKTVGREYRKEAIKFDLSKAKNILHVGCGSYPISAMTFADMNGAKIVTIDINQKSIKLANEILDKEDFNGRITADIGDGSKYPLEKFDTIVISSCSVPKNEVIEHVLKDAKPQSKIIIREAYSSVDALIDRINSHDDIKIMDEIVARPFPTSRWKSFCLMKG